MVGLRTKLAKASLAAVSALILSGNAPALDAFELRVLDSQNSERLRAGTKPLHWNAGLAAGAQEWADYLASSGRFEHSPTPSYAQPEGENIWGGTANAFTAEAMVSSWIAEKRFFISGTFPNNSRTGRIEDVAHYTQLIWAGTGTVGCGRAVARGQEILVCRYSSAGNVYGDRPV